jgi:hypothetical protein
MKRLLTQFLAATLAAVALASPAFADPTWEYSTTATPIAVAPNTPGGSLGLTSQSSFSAPVSGPGPSGIVATTVLGTTGTGTDTYTNASYTIQIQIKDMTSGSIGKFSFVGQFSGTFSATSGSNITNALIDPSTNTATTSNPVVEKQTIGGNTYTVTLFPQVIIGSLGSLPASIGGTVSVVGGSSTPPGGGTTGGGGTVSTTPEPSTMMLSTLGLSVLGLAALRRRLRRQYA